MTTNIYVHVPFCESKCDYCNFCSFPCENSKIETYFDSLISEIENDCHAGLEIKTIYFGGGTPTYVRKENLKRVLHCIRGKYVLAEGAEITLEANPNSVSLKNLKFYRQIGFNRISFGVQSLDGAELKKIARKHNPQKAIWAIKMARLAGFKNISADFLLGIEGQNATKFKFNLKKVLPYLKHISCYMLILEEGTNLIKKVRDGIYSPKNEEECIKIYDSVHKFLRMHGFNRYEVSNFAREGFCCNHNLNIWKMETYLAFGLSACGYIDGERYQNSNNFNEYLNGTGKISEIQSLTFEKEEFLMLGLRLEKGISLKEYENKFNENLEVVKKDDVSLLEKGGFIKIEEGCLKVINFGLLNLIILKLI